MIEELILTFTEHPRSLKIPAQGVTVFVGPNNSGKSLALRELEEDFVSHTQRPLKLIQDISIVWPSTSALEQDLESLKASSPSTTAIDRVQVSRLNPYSGLETSDVQIDQLKRSAAKRDRRWVSSQFYKFFLVRLDGRTRFNLTDDRPKGDLIAHAANMLAKIFIDDELRKRISTIIYDAFRLYFTIDNMNANSLRIRLSEVKPDENEQSWNEHARKFHSAATYIKDSSDGIQAFVGILCAVLSGDFRAILVDEPEAFLHPPLARKLGYQLTKELKEGASLLASTHSSDFLMGCLQASPNVRVVRLEYSRGRSKGRLVDSRELATLLRSPLMRSANVISALFHDGVIVTESDNDRAFYSEMYHRMLDDEPNLPSLLFVNAQNKQTIRDVIGPLRRFGVPAAAVVDIDILKDGGTDLTKWMTAAQVPEALHLGYGQQRSALEQKFSAAGVNMKNGGVALLDTAEQAAANVLFDDLQRFGIFVVRRGELEKWLPELGVQSKKTDWVQQVFEKLKSDSSDEQYARPKGDDVWQFLREVVGWVKDTNRLGVS